MIPVRKEIQLGSLHQQGVQSTSDSHWSEFCTSHSEQTSCLFVDQLSAMLQQETSESYRCKDYLEMQEGELAEWEFPCRHTKLRIGNNGSRRVDECCREQICEWTYRVVDFFDIDREVVSISLSYLDRLLSRKACDRRTYKLAATTSLHLAVKLFHPQKLNELGVLSDLSRGEFVMKDVLEMETAILHGLSWRLNPPTTMAFIKTFLSLVTLPQDKQYDIDNIYRFASYFSQLSVCCYSLATKRPSIVASACILNAIEGLFGANVTRLPHIYQLINQIRPFLNPPETAHVQEKLWTKYEQSEEGNRNHASVSPKCANESIEQISPEPESHPQSPSHCGTGSPISVVSKFCADECMFFHGEYA
eukprot:CAMPEP_0198285314 /NCGR_PEP_ID=MMETSP1449-20131203/4643_1 /TAXON_ID=420275 /ORGANISM="Attheya septentrionalis, Strain CCMP2084" /LENGTH=361 /DNA_ID=CAMNT_0043982709 /DNA_START=167 /DNA_END=1252 /DNA_ORIENTATION=-